MRESIGVGKIGAPESDCPGSSLGSTMYLLCGLGQVSHPQCGDKNLSHFTVLLVRIKLVNISKCPDLA